ncbi:MAG TPA: type 4a pilus biogenesis protein PilO [Frankiaceae bacterium]|nr:type 4a pilus biogenesis protein PilO [Frankiaceae bacterium]
MTKLRQLWALTALGSLVVLAAGYFFLVSPKNTEAADLREETDTQLQANRTLKSQIEMLNKQAKDLPAQQAKLAKFDRLIPPNPAMPALIRALTDAADNSGVELVALNPKLPEYAKGVDAKTRTELPGRVTAPSGTVLVDIPVELKVLGTYSQMTQFFTEIEELNRALLVGGFNIQRAKGDLRKLGMSTPVEDDNMLRAELQAHVLMTRKAPAPPVAKTTTSSSSDETK